MAVEKRRDYAGKNIDVHYDVKRCIHAEECVKRLSAVFDVQQRPWIQPDNAAADDLAETIQHCPSGALHYTRKDGADAEAIPQENTLRIEPDGPLYVRGNVTVQDAFDEQALDDTRIALCRCGASNNKPFCDNRHLEIGFTDSALPSPSPDSEAAVTTRGKLTIAPANNGPLLLSGNFEILSADGTIIFKGDDAALCRCGGSSNKPFCDGTHKSNGFTSA